MCYLLFLFYNSFQQLTNKNKKLLKLKRYTFKRQPVYCDAAIVGLIALIMTTDSYYIFGGRLLAPTRQTEFH